MVCTLNKGKVPEKNAGWIIYTFVTKEYEIATFTFFFNVLLTVHLSIFILVIIQLDAQNLFNNKFISCL